MPRRDPEQHRQDARAYYYRNRERILARRKKRYHSDPEWREQVLRENKDWHVANPEGHRTRMRKWRNKNRAANNRRASEYAARRKRTDPVYRFACSVRTRFGNAIRNGTKGGRLAELLGCSVEKAMAHIEAQFEPGMTWKNYGRQTWHIDHIRPLASFPDLLHDAAQQRAACHFTNLRPMWASENLAKGSAWGGRRHGAWHRRKAE